MENIASDNKKSGFGPILLGTLMVIGALLFPLGLLIVPAFAAFLYFNRKPAYAGIVTAEYMLLSFVFYGRNAAITLSMLFAAIVFILILTAKKKTSSFLSAAALCGALILICYTALCLPGMLSGNGAFSYIEDYIAGLSERYLIELRALLAANPADGIGRMLNSIESAFHTLTVNIGVWLVPGIITLSIILGTANFLFFHLFAKKNTPEIEKLPAFRYWHIPAEYTGGICFLLVASLVIQLTGLSFGGGVTASVNALVNFPLQLQGLALIDYTIVWKSKRVRRTRLIVYILIGLLFTLFGTTITLLGCAEQFLHLRDRADILNGKNL